LPAAFFIPPLALLGRDRIFSFTNKPLGVVASFAGVGSNGARFSRLSRIRAICALNGLVILP
jgi:hypothetical protein